MNLLMNIILNNLFFSRENGAANGMVQAGHINQARLLTGMANLSSMTINSMYVLRADYVKLLRLYTHQHFLPDGKINLVENYDPDNGGPIVYYYWSNHYNHSSFNNLVITGLCGIRPSASDTLVVNPLVDSSISYFYLDNLNYHGHRLTVVYDRDGSKYKMGKGLIVFADDKKLDLLQEGKKTIAVIGASIVAAKQKQLENYALNLTRQGYPKPSASCNTEPDSIYQAIDGRIWYFPEISNRWTTLGSGSQDDWYALDFGNAREISTVKLYLFGDDKTFDTPDSFRIEYMTNGRWQPVQLKKSESLKPVVNTVNSIEFDKITSTSIRILFTHRKGEVAVSEIECGL